MRRLLGVGTALPEPGERAPHQAGLVGSEGGEVEALRGESGRQARLDDHVDLRDQAAQHVGGVVVLEVERHRALAAVVRLHGAGDHARRVAGAARFDAQHVGTEVGEDTRAVRAGLGARQVEDAEM